MFKSYFKRFNSLPEIISEKPDDNTGIIVVIPCYREPSVKKTILSILDSSNLKSKGEIIVVINSGENEDNDIIDFNRKTYSQLKEMSEKIKSNFKLFPLLFEGIHRKQAGVGNARKIGMDEAVRRFDKIKKNGIIVSLDADCIINKNYLSQLEVFLNEKTNNGACIPQFQHDFDIKKYDDNVIQAARLYEIYLRYFRLAIKSTGFTHALHTIGSCFAVKAKTYTQAGGMSKRQGGEDFYFIHKLTPITKIALLEKAMVYPSPRISNRVPFGTGPAVAKIISDKSYNVYNFDNFKILGDFYSLFNQFYNDVDVAFCDVPDKIIKFYGCDKIYSDILECEKNTGNINAFEKRMFTKFNAFFIVKFLNSLKNDITYGNEDILISSAKLLNHYNFAPKELSIKSIYNKIFKLDLKLK